MKEKTDNEVIVGNAQAILYVYSSLMQLSLGNSVVRLVANKANAGKLVDAVEILRTIEPMEVEYKSWTKSVKDEGMHEAFLSILQADVRFTRQAEKGIAQGVVINGAAGNQTAKAQNAC